MSGSDEKRSRKDQYDSNVRRQRSSSQRSRRISQNATSSVASSSDQQPLSTANFIQSQNATSSVAHLAVNVVTQGVADVNLSRKKRRKSSHGSKPQEKAGSSRTGAEKEKSPPQSQDQDGQPSTSSDESGVFRAVPNPYGYETGPLPNEGRGRLLAPPTQRPDKSWMENGKHSKNGSTFVVPGYDKQAPQIQKSRKTTNTRNYPPLPPNPIPEDSTQKPSTPIESVPTVHRRSGSSHERKCPAAQTLAKLKKEEERKKKIAQESKSTKSTQKPSNFNRSSSESKLEKVTDNPKATTSGNVMSGEGGNQGASQTLHKDSLRKSRSVPRKLKQKTQKKTSSNEPVTSQNLKKDSTKRSSSINLKSENQESKNSKNNKPSASKQSIEERKSEDFDEGTSQDQKNLKVDKNVSSTSKPNKKMKKSKSSEIKSMKTGLSDANERKSSKDTAETAKKDLSVSVSASRKVKEASPGPLSTTTRRSHGDSTPTRSLSKSHQKALSKKKGHDKPSTKMPDAKPPRPARSSSHNPGKVRAEGKADPTEESEQPRTSKQGGDGTGTKRGSTTQNLGKRPKH